MSRTKSQHICEKCGKHGFQRTNPVAVVHYDSKTGRRKTCYTKNLLKRNQNVIKERSQIEHDHVLPEKITAEDPPERFWGESPLFLKVGDLARQFHLIGRHLEKVQEQVYKFKPDEKISLQCVDDLELFENHFLKPIQKLLIPYHDKRWGGNWDAWFKVQMDSFIHGPRAAGIMNAVPTGEFLLQESKDPDFDVVMTPIEREYTSLQVKKKQGQVLKFANELLASHPLNRALNRWSNETIIESESTEQILSSYFLFKRRYLRR